MTDFDKQQSQRPAQTQSHQPGQESLMKPAPIFIRNEYCGSGKLKDCVALITGGDSGIGRAVAVHFAREGAHIVIVYLEEDQDAADTCSLVEAENRNCLMLKGDVGFADFCKGAVRETMNRFGRLDILVNNAAEQHPADQLEDISEAQLKQSFRTNFFGYFHLAQAALPVMKAGGSIINTSSVTAYRGSSELLDYAATKGAITAFTRSLAQTVADRGIRVNSVAPGPIWTPLIPASFDADKVKSFGEDTLLGRAGQPCEVATCFVFLASRDASYFTGQTLHPNGGGFLGT